MSDVSKMTNAEFDAYLQEINERAVAALNLNVDVEARLAEIKRQLGWPAQR